MGCDPNLWEGIVLFDTSIWGGLFTVVILGWDCKYTLGIIDFCPDEVGTPVYGRETAKVNWEASTFWGGWKLVTVLDYLTGEPLIILVSRSSSKC